MKFTNILGCKSNKAVIPASEKTHIQEVIYHKDFGEVIIKYKNPELKWQEKVDKQRSNGHDR